MVKATNTNATDTARAIFKCTGTKGCGAVSRRTVVKLGSNFIRPEGVRDAGLPDARPIARCDCGRFLFGRPIVGTTNPEKKCNARCLSATGPACDCSCGGENHGAAHGA